MIRKFVLAYVSMMDHLYPVTSYQFRAVNEHARMVLNDLYDIGIREGFTKSDILNAIRNYWNYTK